MKEAITYINHLGKARIPFLFIIDFDHKQPIILRLDEVDEKEILFDVNGRKNFEIVPLNPKKLRFEGFPVDKNRYRQAFDDVIENIRYGNSFLLNLTMPSRIETNFSIKDIFFQSQAKYKLWLKNRFVVFSPEIFIRINDRKIRSFPMKGTIDASLPDAENLLLNNEKELAEHYTIVDLIRNDLSMVSKNVKVERFRYLDRLKTNRNELLQMSSEISGDLPDNFHENLGDMLFTLLPAGSISGAPKKKTIEIIRKAEQYERGFYTGIFGIFDGENLDSGVMIRFIEQTAEGMFYKSGGGITAKSNCEEEFQELIAKIYVPIT
jgi:para-aminobenzoate synthetase component 1